MADKTLDELISGIEESKENLAQAISEKGVDATGMSLSEMSSAVDAINQGVQSSTITYQVSSSGTTIPTGTWSSSIPSVSAGQYLWTRVVLLYFSGDEATFYSISRNGTNGSTPTIKASSGSNVGAVGTPTVTASTSGTTTTFTFDYLKGATGATGPQGPQGPRGEKGDPFSVSKVYSSVSAMNSGFSSDGVPSGGFVLIDTGNVNDADNAKLYYKGATAYTFLTDLSGAQGIQGPQGVQGIQGIQGEKGEKGETGPQGPQGNQGVTPTIKATTGANVAATGTPTVTASTSGTTTTFTFNYLRGATGAQGPQGETGPQGPTGATGETGPQGPAGSIWYTGTAVTGTSTSAVTASVSGSKAGDMYLNSSTCNVYRAAAANSWVYVCNIKGANGVDATAPNPKVINLTASNWVADSTNGGYKYSITAATHGMGQYPDVRTYVNNEETYDSPKVDASGNITLFSNLAIAMRVVIKK